MSASAAAHDGSRSTKALTATRSCTTTWRLMRSTRWPAVASSRPGWSRQVVRATFTMRSALRSSSWAIRSATPTKRRSAGRRPGRPDDAEALVLDRVAQRVDGVVVGDRPDRRGRGRRRRGPRCPNGRRRGSSDASRTTSSRTSSTRSRTCGSECSGTTSEETTSRSWMRLQHVGRGAPPTVSPLFTFQPPCSYGASMGSPYAPRG